MRACVSGCPAMTTGQDAAAPRPRQVRAPSSDGDADRAPASRARVDGEAVAGPSYQSHGGWHGATLAARVAAAIEREIVALGWPVGEVIASEAELLARHGVSRPVM